MPEAPIYEDLDKKILALEDECKRLRKKEAESEKHRSYLKDMVNERTCELADANRQLAKEQDEREKIDAALEASEKRVQTFVQMAIQGYCVTDTNGKILAVNPAYCAMTGYSEMELLTMDLSNIVAVESYEEIVGHMKAVQQEGVARFESIHQRKDGGNLYVEVSTHYTPVDDGRFVNVILDVTERKQSENELRENRRFIETILNTSPDIIYVYDLIENRTIYNNQRIIDLLGYTISELEKIGDRMIKKMMHPDDFPDYQRLVTFRYPTLMDNELLEYEYRMKHKNGEWRWFLSRESVFMRQEDGQPKQIFGMVTDITERKRTEVQQRNLEAQLQQAHKMESIGTLAGGVAHDFNNILGIILGNTELALADVPEWNPARTSLYEVKVACLRARDVVKQILAFSRKADHELKKVQLDAIVSDTIKLIRSTIPTTIDIHEIPPQEALFIMGDATQINQVLLNLCANASHAMQEKGGILSVALDRICLEEKSELILTDLNVGDYVKLTVRDTGHGIADEDLQRIFDPYFTTKCVGEGTGMGLAVVHGIVQQHRGAIRVNSKKGKGTTFEVYFPVAEKGKGPVAEHNESIPGGNEHILFVDDEPGITKIYKTMFERLGYTVSARTSSIEALEAFKAQPDKFDLVITDQTMPHMTGQILSREILAIKPQIPIILCTGHSDLVDKDNANELGIKALIMKPISISEIANTIRELLDLN